jgi:putative tryptophan/tyrosine transport system substrate-binding protein
MRRRDFLGFLGAVAWPLGARSQESGRVYRLGFLIPSGREAPPIVAFFDELRHHGFVEGQNLRVVPGGFGVKDDQIPELAIALAKAQPDVIVSAGEPTRELQKITSTIPLLAMSEDMLADGLVQSLARPGGNTTGLSILSPDLDGKRQDLLMDAVPKARRIGALAEARTTPPRHVEELKRVARTRGVDLHVVPVATTGEIVSALDRAKANGIEALNVLATPLFGSYANRRIVMDRVAALRLPAIYQWPDMAEEGGLLAYGPSFTEIYRQRARTVARVLRGAKPADIPVEQPTRFELVINLKTAKAIGHDIPAGLVLRSDKLIE